MTNENTLTQINNIPGVEEVITRLTTMETLYQYYKPVEVEGYCSACPNFGRIWSCPPFDFDVTTYLAPYEHVLIIGLKTADFEVTRRRFGDILKSIDSNDKTDDCSRQLEVLIAGNCYHCDVCTKTIGVPCILNKGPKYSLEALGFHVGDICEHILDAPLDWSGNEGTFMTVGAILSNSKELLEALL